MAVVFCLCMFVCGDGWVLCFVCVCLLGVVDVGGGGGYADCFAFSIECFTIFFTKD